MSKYHMGGFHSPKAYLDAQCSYAPGSERTQGLRLLKSVWSGGEYYAAVQPYDETGAVEPVLAIVCLVRWNPKSTSGQHFGFKDMDEGMGPCEAKCPASVLDLLGPPRNEYANATGFGHDCPDMARLAAVLTPYCKWNQVRPFDEPEPNDGGFTVLQVRPLLHALLDRVHDVTGHPRPKGWPRKRPGSATPARCLTSPPPNGGNYAPSR
ncbi:hypothetical protein [Sphingopyxis sp. H053]|nr:hypothetical protein [Sphingopyxis sp. H053]